MMKQVDNITIVLLLTAVLCMGGCGMTGGTLKNESAEQLCDSSANSHTVGELSFVTGGAKSKEFKRNREYRRLKVVFLEGTQGPTLTSSKDPDSDEFKVGIDSAHGKRIQVFVNNEKPWKWNSLEAIPFANHLVLSGDLGGRHWQYSSVYPDNKIASFIKEVRRLLSGQ